MYQQWHYSILWKNELIKNNQLALIKSIPVVEYRLSGEETFEFCPPKEGAK